MLILAAPRRDQAAQTSSRRASALASEPDAYLLSCSLLHNLDCKHLHTLAHAHLWIFAQCFKPFCAKYSRGMNYGAQRLQASNCNKEHKVAHEDRSEYRRFIATRNLGSLVATRPVPSPKRKKIKTMIWQSFNFRTHEARKHTQFPRSQTWT